MSHVPKADAFWLGAVGNTLSISMWMWDMSWSRDVVDIGWKGGIMGKDNGMDGYSRFEIIPFLPIHNPMHKLRIPKQ